MVDEASLYRERADAERRNADAATLDNVRIRAERAEAAWAAMADRSDRTRIQRQEREAQAVAARTARDADAAANPDSDPAG
ncbi:hypothetical protein GGR88_002162 [Sphingomonas jejuensis]|uniref:Uncharacterized protein n=1 Tax=Sphingomonas jejuensis TaxID=904715 RepID=A0ABX0XMP1_9SPHN|nr:hypothetical protein [Sphingomonas jejuensis]NJC34648.1 hypothetical protein [Sphingomonas jejuensis]